MCPSRLPTRHQIQTPLICSFPGYAFCSCSWSSLFTIFPRDWPLALGSALWAKHRRPPLRRLSIWQLALACKTFLKVFVVFRFTANYFLFRLGSLIAVGWLRLLPFPGIPLWPVEWDG